MGKGGFVVVGCFFFFSYRGKGETMYFWRSLVNQKKQLPTPSCC